MSPLRTEDATPPRPTVDRPSRDPVDHPGRLPNESGPHPTSRSCRSPDGPRVRLLRSVKPADGRTSRVAVSRSPCAPFSGGKAIECIDAERRGQGVDEAGTSGVR